MVGSIYRKAAIENSLIVLVCIVTILTLVTLAPRQADPIDTKFIEVAGSLG